MDFRKKYLVKPDGKVKLKDIDPRDTGKYDKLSAAKEFATHVDRLKNLQYRLYAESKRGLLIVLQAMDAGGKDGTIRHVLAPMNPQGTKAVSFKVPTAEERSHDFLWRIHEHAPAKGEVVIFNRSHYEDVLVVRVHNLVPKDVWKARYEIINDFESLLSRSDIHIIKIFLHISKDEQLQRFAKRLNRPEKHWKISESDYTERERWDEYQDAFEDALSNCSRDHAPWYVVPADKKWYRNLVVSQIVADTMEDMDLSLPEPTVDIAAIKRAYHKAANSK